MTKTDSPTCLGPHIRDPQPFVASAKIQTFVAKRNAVRAAIRREGTPAIQEAWDAFEGFTDCISMEQQDTGHGAPWAQQWIAEQIERAKT